MYLNKAIIIGNLTRDPELKAIASGVKVTTMSVATNRVWKDQSGQRKEQTDYHNVVVFGRQAETAAQFLKKGSQVLIEGRMQTRSWDAQDGTKKYRTEVIADRVQFGSRGQGGQSEGGYQKGSAPQPAKDVAEEIDTIEYPEDDISAEDIPF